MNNMNCIIMNECKELVILSSWNEQVAPVLQHSLTHALCYYSIRHWYRPNYLVNFKTMYDVQV